MNIGKIYKEVLQKRSYGFVFRGTGTGLALVLMLSLTACSPKTETAVPDTSSSPPTNASANSAPVSTASATSQAELAARFNASSETLFEAKTSTDLMKCRMLQQCELVATADGVKIIATGDDAAILLPPFAEGKRFILQVIIDSPMDTGIQLFHMLRGQGAYEEARAPIYPLKKGKNTVYFKVDEDNIVDPLRLDPSFKSGEYTINSIVARPIPTPASQ